MILKEYRVCMPLTTDEYRGGQQYMISRHSDEQSNAGEGVEVVCNEPYNDEYYGQGKYTEKRIHLNSRLPSWARAITPAIYVTEKAWNYYPYSVTVSFSSSFDNIYRNKIRGQQWKNRIKRNKILQGERPWRDGG